MNEFKRRRSFYFILPALVVLVTASAYRWKDESDYFFRVNKGLELFGQIYREVAQNYVDEIEPDAFIAAGIDGMLGTLDPYTVYLDKQEVVDIDALTSGSYAGIGISVGMRDSAVTVVDVIDGYSARRAGVRIGDQIETVDGADVLHGPVESLRERMRGEANTTLTLGLRRVGVDHPITIRLTREMIRVRSVSYSTRLPNDIAYVRLDRFGSLAGSEVRDAIGSMERQGQIRGLVLDLRDNPGGLLESAVDVVSSFVPVGSVVVSTRGRDPQDDRVYRSERDPVFEGAPIVVLVNENSASASEIVAGAIQDLDAGVIVGQRSFGKGLVQSVRRLPYETSLKITTARYYTPSGRCIQKVDYRARRDGHAPDTARRAFQTVHGRTVADRGGIEPDTAVQPGNLPPGLSWIDDDGFMFPFATRVAAGMEFCPTTYRVDDGTLARFEDYCIDRLDSIGGGESLKAARSAVRLAVIERLGPDVVGHARRLVTEMIAERRSLFHYHAEQVRAALEDEIWSRFRDQRERIAATIATDRQLSVALSLMRTGSLAYGRLLSAW